RIETAIIAAAAISGGDYAVLHAVSVVGERGLRIGEVPDAEAFGIGEGSPDHGLARLALPGRNRVVHALDRPAEDSWLETRTGIEALHQRFDAGYPAPFGVQHYG